MNVTSIHTVVYENKWQRTLGENKANSNPNKANSNPITANKMPIQTQNKANTNPNKPNFIHHSLGEGGFKRYLAKMAHHELKYIDRLGQLTLNLFIKVNTQASSAERT